jgi:hypothetical protein
MKPMSDRAMKMKKGEHESFFPSDAHMKKMGAPGEIKGFKYPDTEEAIYACQEHDTKEVSKNMPKPEFRH